MIVFGIDPGLATAGIAQIRDGRVEWAKTIRGGSSPPANWNITGPLIQAVATRVWTEVEERIRVLDVDRPLVAVEGYVYQGPRGEGRLDNRHFWKGAAVTGAIAALAPATVEVVWQNADVVLRRGGTGYGDLKVLLASRSAKSVDPDGRVGNDHVASAVCHALFAEASRRVLSLAL